MMVEEYVELLMKLPVPACLVSSDRDFVVSNDNLRALLRFVPSGPDSVRGLEDLLLKKVFPQLPQEVWLGGKRSAAFSDFLGRN